MTCSKLARKSTKWQDKCNKIWPHPLSQGINFTNCNLQTFYLQICLFVVQETSRYTVFPSLIRGFFTELDLKLHKNWSFQPDSAPLFFQFHNSRKFARTCLPRITRAACIMVQMCWHLQFDAMGSLLSFYCRLFCYTNYRWRLRACGPFVIK